MYSVGAINIRIHPSWVPRKHFWHMFYAHRLYIFTASSPNRDVSAAGINREMRRASPEHTTAFTDTQAPITRHTQPHTHTHRPRTHTATQDTNTPSPHLTVHCTTHAHSHTPHNRAPQRGSAQDTSLHTFCMHNPLTAHTCTRSTVCLASTLLADRVRDERDDDTHACAGRRVCTTVMNTRYKTLH
jgi:hypothetical protein